MTNNRVIVAALANARQGTDARASTRGLRRREVLFGLAGVSLAPWLGFGCSEASIHGELWLGAEGREAADYALSMTGPAGELRSVLTGFRGHDVARDPRDPGRVVLFARRPGLQGLEIDLRRGAVLRRFDAAAGRRLQGHGFFSADGALLYSVEADEVSGAGSLIVRDTADLKIRDELPTGGIGPHQALLSLDSESVIVANGGILTRPTSGRKKLNLDTMDSSLVYLDRRSGELLERWRVPEPKASIRHLALTSDGSVAFGLQLQRAAMDHDEVVAVGGVHRRGEAPRLFDASAPETRAMNDYVGSVALSEARRVVALTGPKSNLVTFWSLDSGRCLGLHQLADCSGVTLSADHRRFIISSSTGELRQIDCATLKECRPKRLSLEGAAWDNHLITTEVL